MSLEDDPARERLLQATHQQFAENQRTREGLFVRLLPLLGGVVAGYAYTYHSYYEQTDVFSLITTASIMLMVVGAWMVCVLAHNFRRDQELNARIRNEFGVIGDDNVYPRSYDPSLSIGSRHLLSWMPDFYCVFYALLGAVQVLLGLAFLHRAQIHFTIYPSEMSGPATVAASATVIGVVCTATASIYYLHKILLHFRLIEATSFRHFAFSQLWIRPSKLRALTGRSQNIRDRFWRLIRMSADLSSAGQQLMGDIDDDDTLRQVVAFHAVRAHSVLRAITAAADSGYATETVVLLRSLLLLDINLRWILVSDAEARAERFADFEIVKKVLAGRVLRDHSALDEETKRSYDTFLLDELEELKEKYDITSDEQLLSWSGHSIEEMAQEVDLLDVYRLQFTYSDDIGDTSPNMVNHYLGRTEDGKVRLKSETTDDNVELVLLEAMRLFSNVMELFQRVLERRSRRFAKLSRAVLSAYEDYVRRVQAEDEGVAGA